MTSRDEQMREPLTLVFVLLLTVCSVQVAFEWVVTIMWAFYLTKENKKGNTEYTDYDIEDITYMAARRHEISLRSSVVNLSFTSSLAKYFSNMKREISYLQGPPNFLFIIHK